MYQSKRIVTLFLTCLSIFLFQASSLFPSQVKQVTIAVVKDGPRAESDIAKRVEAELQKFITPDIELKLKAAPEFDAQWKPERMRGVLQNAMDDPEVDIVLVTGALVTQQAVKEDFVLTKPVVSSYVQTAGLFRAPFSEEDRSLKKNLSFILVPHMIDRDIHTFREMFSWSSLHITLGEEYLEQGEFVRAEIEKMATKLGIDINFISISDNISESLSRIGEDVEAVVLSEAPRLSAADRRILIRDLTARKIPTFSFQGYPDVELGALAALAPDIIVLVARRAALNINQLIRGESTSDLPIFLSMDLKLLINGRTAAELGYFPNYEVRAMADFLYEDALKRDAATLTLEEAMKRARENNTSLSISDSQVETSRLTMQVAKSSLFPQIFAGAGFQYDDPWGRLKEIFPKNQTVAGLTLSQVLYDDEVISDYRSSQRLFEGTQYEHEQKRLDVLSDAGEAFLRYVLSRLLYQIELENLKLTEENRDLAEIRVRVGHAGRDEVFRWEAELARQRSTLLNVAAITESLRISLNQVLGAPQDVQWDPEEINVDPEVFTFLDSDLSQIFKNAQTYEKFREFMVQLAFVNSPELMYLDNAIEALGIQFGQRKRKFYLPKVTANLSYDYQISRSPELTDLSRSWFTFALSATYPLFSGGAKYHDMKRISSQLETLERETKLAQELVEKRIRTALQKVENSFPSIQFSRVAAENALKYLDVVQEKYGIGILNVTDLLEAQNASFIASQNAAISVYSYLLDMLALQRGMAWFELDKTDEERKELLDNIYIFMNSQDIHTKKANEKEMEK